jgi:eukaryotic-like serine/threonine-protein kinase
MARAFQVVSLLAVLAVLGWAVWTYVIPHPTTVPDLRGDPLNVAEQEADAAGLDLVTGGQEFDSEVPAGAVISQNMEPGSEAEEGDLLSVLLSRGPELEPVPQVVGLPEEEARTQLEDARFKVAIQREYNDTIPKGQVIEQTPDPDTALEVGKQVRLTVSRGKEPVTIPNVGGNTSAEASALIQGAGLGVRVVQEFSTDVPRDIVIRQIPQADRSVPVGTTVTIVVSKGPQQFPMPNMIGKPASQAQAELQGAGLVVNAVDLPGSTGDEVVGQNPKAGVIVEAGQQVTIYIGGG